MRVGIIEFTAQDTRLGALLAPDVAWHSPSHELKPSMKSSPADAVVFHVKLDDRADIADALKDAAATNPRVRMLLAASSSQAAWRSRRASRWAGPARCWSTSIGLKEATDGPSTSVAAW